MIEQWSKMRAQLTLHEGRRKFPYVDTVGQTTIGVGWNLTANGLPDEIIDRLLDISIGNAWSDLQKALPWTSKLDPVRQRVLWDMAFNLGIAGLLAFHDTLLAVENGRYEQAAYRMLQSKWAGQVGRRAVTLAQMMRTGQDG